MATITGLTMTITRVYATTGTTCTIDYSYTLTCTPTEQTLGGLTFKAETELWGKDGGLFDPDDSLGTPPYDTHVITCADPMPIRRSYALFNCSMLSEDWFGTDEIYLRLKVTPSVGPLDDPLHPKTIVSDSPVVNGYF
jgi:hypothetical protein